MKAEIYQKTRFYNLIGGYTRGYVAPPIASNGEPIIISGKTDERLILDTNVVDKEGERVNSAVVSIENIAGDTPDIQECYFLPPDLDLGKKDLITIFGEETVREFCLWRIRIGESSNEE